MNQFVTEQLIYVLRLVAAALCGGLIGCERQSKKKTAGTRTHVIIAVASAMMMIISKYGFGDVLNEYVKLDPSRVAAGVVTFGCPYGTNDILFSFITCHDDKISTIKFLITEVDDSRMASIMFP